MFNTDNPAVHILSATKEHADDAIKHITEVAPKAPELITTHQLDLGTLSQVISVSKTLADLPRIDMLFLIAGIGVAPFGLTNDGIGNHYGINLISGMCITDILLPKLIETSKSKQGGSEEEKFSTRIVVESSELHRGAPSDVKCENLEEFSHDMDPALLYNRSKLLQ